MKNGINPSKTPDTCEIFLISVKYPDVNIRKFKNSIERIKKISSFAEFFEQANFNLTTNELQDIFEEVLFN
jgi:hypothetical protein